MIIGIFVWLLFTLDDYAQPSYAASNHAMLYDTMERGTQLLERAAASRTSAIAMPR